MSLRVAIDLKPMSGQATGVGRMLQGVLDGFEELDAESCEGLELHTLQPRSPWRTLPWVQLALPAASLARRADVLHCAFYYLPLLAPCRSVVVIHDLLILDEPQLFPWRGRHPFGDLMTVSARRAERIIVPSKTVRAGLGERFGAAVADKVRVIPHGVDSARFQIPSAAAIAATTQRYQLDRPFLLHVGSLQSRRGLPTLFESLRVLRKDHPELELAVVGRTDHRWGRVPADLGKAVRMLGFVEDCELPALYAAATAFCSMTSGEGFNLPILEALACGGRVLASDLAVHQEHFADWARFAPVGDFEAVADTLGPWLEADPEPAQQHRQIEAVTSRFNWPKAAKAHLEVWREAAS